MKPAAVALLVGLGSVPVLAIAGVDYIGSDDVRRVLDGENVADVAADIAQREFSARARLDIIEIVTRDWTSDAWGGVVRADDGHVFHHVRVRVTNDGRLDIPVHTRHFRAFDDIDHAWKAEWGLAHNIDRARLPLGDSEIGLVVFEMPHYVPLVRVEYAGEFSSANATVADMAPRAAPEEASAPEPPREEPAAAPPPEEDDEYQSHWEG